MSHKLRFIWLRHAKPLVTKGYIYGSEETVDLNLTGDRTVSAFKAIAGIIPHDSTIVTSPSPRAKTSIKEVLKRHNATFKITEDKRFLEQNFGTWTGLNQRDIRDTPELIAYQKNMEEVAPPNGENLREVRARVNNGIQDYIRKFSAGELHGNTVVISGHGGVTRAALAIAFGIESHHFNRTKIRRLSVSITEFDTQRDKWGIITVNDTLDPLKT